MLGRVSTRNLVIVIIAVFAFALAVWPGRWTYTTVDNVPMRTNRITGRSELFAAGRWISLEGGTSGTAAPSADTTRMLDEVGRELVTGRGGVDGTGYFTGSIYNGTPCTLKRIVYWVRTKAGRDTTQRAFSETEFIPPRQTKDVIFKVDVFDANRRFLSWGIDSVEATCAINRPGKS